MHTLQVFLAYAALLSLLLWLYLVSVASIAANTHIVALKKIGKVKSPVHETFAYLEIIYTWIRHFIPYRHRAGNRPATDVPKLRRAFAQWAQLLSI